MITLRTFKALVAITLISSCSSGSSNSAEQSEAQPEIVAFSASATKVKVNTEVALSWESKNTENCLVKNEANKVLAEGQNGSTNQTIDTTTNFTLWCHQGGKSVEAKLMVTATTGSGIRIVNQDVSDQPNLWNLDHIDGEMDGFFKAFGSGKGVRVYIIDTGVFGSHPEFEDRVLEGNNIFGEMVEGTGNVGYPKKGWLDTMGSKAPLNGVGARTPFYDDHGTHVAGIVAGKTYGIAKDATIIPVRMSDGQFVDQSKPEIGREVLLKALQFVLENEEKFSTGRAVINLSMLVDRYMRFDGEWVNLEAHVLENGTVEGFIDPLDAEFERITTEIVAKGIPIFSASGNSGCSSFLGLTGRFMVQNLANRVPGVINVGNLARYGDTGELYAWNTSLMPEFWAPGHEILSATASFTDGELEYGSKTDIGTSMASPLLAGLAAIYLERFPDMKAADFEDVFKQNSSSRKRLDHQGNVTCRPIEDKDVFIPFLGQP